MLNLQVIGNLGADAERRENNGRAFVTFRVAHSEKRNDVERTTWVSCVLNGDGGLLAQYLVKGTKVFVSGRVTLKTYSSPKTHQIEAGLDLNVDRIELCGGRDAQLTKESIAAWITNNPNEAKAILDELPF